MPTLTPPSLHAFCSFPKSRPGRQIRRFKVPQYIPLQFGINQDTVDAYEKRHQRFLQALRREPVPRENGNTPSREEADNDTSTKLRGRSNVYRIRPRKSFIKQARSVPGRSQTEEPAKEDELGFAENPKVRPWRRPAWVYELRYIRAAAREAQQPGESNSVSFTPNIPLQKPTDSISRSQTEDPAKEDEVGFSENYNDRAYRRTAWMHKLGNVSSGNANWTTRAAGEAQQPSESNSVSFTPNIPLQKPTDSISKGPGGGPVHHPGVLQEPAFPKEKEIEPRKILSPPKLTLFEELFPDEIENPATKTPSLSQKELPKLTIPEFEEDDARFEDQYVAQRKKGVEITKSASTDAYKNWDLAILVLQIASPSLTESDFRRIAPKGEHIRDWVGPGDIFKGIIRDLPPKFATTNDEVKVIPARDPTTLQQRTHYFLVFPNPAYARAYQHHVHHLHNLAQTHTPTSIKSPMAPPEGMIVHGEDTHDLLQNYTLLPPSQRMHLTARFPPYSESLKRLLECRGYPELMVPKDKTGRCVLFWVEGFVPTIEQVRQLLYRDGRARGLVWALSDGKDSVQQLEPDASLESGKGSDMESQPPSEDSEQQGFGDYLRRSLRRWTIAFEGEDEARRFVRRWHLKPFSSAFMERAHAGDHKPLVHAEFMW